LGWDGRLVVFVVRHLWDRGRVLLRVGVGVGVGVVRRRGGMGRRIGPSVVVRLVCLFPMMIFELWFFYVAFLDVVVVVVVVVDVDVDVDVDVAVVWKRWPMK